MVSKMKKNNKCILKNSMLDKVIVENVLELLNVKDFAIAELLVEIRRRLSCSLLSCKLLKKYLYI
jgi:hypothetical protein